MAEDHARLRTVGLEYSSRGQDVLSSSSGLRGRAHEDTRLELLVPGDKGRRVVNATGTHRRIPGA